MIKRLILPFLCLVFSLLDPIDAAWVQVSIGHQRRSSSSSSSYLNQNPKWLDNAMGNNDDASENRDDERNKIERSRLSQVLPLQSGLAGFCLDPDLGFVAVVSDGNKCGSIVVSSTDQGQQVTSPEALTMVQLAGGLDLATTILPPDLMETLVREEAQDNEKNDDNDPTANLKSAFYSLNRVTARRVERPETSEEPLLDEEEEPPSPPPFSEARQQAMQDSLPKVHAAIQKLPNLSNVTPEQVFAQIQLFANDEGTLDRSSFSRVLQALRRPPRRPQSTHAVSFDIEIQVIAQDCLRQVQVVVTNPVWALGLAMRHKQTLVVDENLLELPCDQILKRFPHFRPMKELWQDAQIMDGFIPTMFQKAQEQKTEENKEDD